MFWIYVNLWQFSWMFTLLKRLIRVSIFPHLILQKIKKYSLLVELNWQSNYEWTEIAK